MTHQNQTGTSTAQKLNKLALSNANTKKYFGYAAKLSRKYLRSSSYRVTYDDLLSAGIEGLAFALSHYNADYKKPDRYFYKCILGYILREVEKAYKDPTTLAFEDSDESVIESFADDRDLQDDTSLRLLAADVRKQIAKLPRKERNYAVLALIEGCSAKEVRQKLSVTRQRVYQLEKTVTAKLMKWNRHAA